MLFKPGERIRMRFFNAGVVQLSMSIFLVSKKDGETWCRLSGGLRVPASHQ